MKKKIILNALLFMGLCFAAPQVVNANTTCLQVQNTDNGRQVTDTITKEIKTTDKDGRTTITTIVIKIYDDGTVEQTTTTHTYVTPNTGLSH